MADKTINYNFNKPNPITNPDDPFDLKLFIADNMDLIDELLKRKADLIGGKLPTSQLALDNSPTEGSDNPIKSGATKTALDKKLDKTDAFSGEYGDLENIPDSFTPSAHSHSFNSITDKPENYPPSSHTHSGSNINQDSTHRFVSDGEKAKWNDKADEKTFNITIPSSSWTTSGNVKYKQVSP